MLSKFLCLLLSGFKIFVGYIFPYKWSLILGYFLNSRSINSILWGLSNNRTLHDKSLIIFWSRENLQKYKIFKSKF